MKKIIFDTCIVTLIVASAHAQTNTFPATGNVGIGILSPTNTLHVIGNVSANNSSTLTSNSVAINAGNTTAASSANVNRLRFGGTDLNSSYFTIQGPSNKDYFTINNGNVGIGTTVPVVPIEVKVPGAAINGSTDLVALFRNSNLSSSNSSGEVKIGLGFSNHYAAAISAAKETFNTTGLRFYTELGSNTPKLAMAISAAGYVGIGISSPQSILDVNGAISAGNGSVNTNTTKLFLRNNAGKTWALSSGANGVAENIFSIYNWTDNSSTPYFNILSSGNIGIATTSPQAQLDVNGDFRLGVGGGTGGTAYAIAFTRTGNAQLYANGAGGLLLGGDASGVDLNILPGGNVLIGKTSQANSTYKLDVNGNARANKIVVNTTGADYVFDSSYELQPLEAVEHFVRTFHHLSDIPTAAEMESEGLDLGDNHILLLKKTEELTLYIIEQNKALKEQQSMIKLLKEEIDQQKKEIDLLKQNIANPTKSK